MLRYNGNIFELLVVESKYSQLVTFQNNRNKFINIIQCACNIDM